jgi:hypothetical protein
VRNPSLPVRNLKGREKRDDQTSQVRSIHWSPYDRVGVVNAVP